jgi:hypothetical protein
MPIIDSATTPFEQPPKALDLIDAVDRLGGPVYKLTALPRRIEGKRNGRAA